MNVIKSSSSAAMAPATAAEEEVIRKTKDKKGIRNGRKVDEKVIRKKDCGTGAGSDGRRVRRRVQAESTAIQRVFLACRKVFKGPETVPPPDDVEMLQVLLDKMRPEDLGLSSDIIFFRNGTKAKGIPRITCTTIYKCDNFSICIFFLPPAAVIPLHNHPGMTVFCKLLFGTMHIKSYDWIQLDDSHESKSSSQFRLARLVVDSDFTAPCDTSVLYPTTGGNMHTFTAITPCAVLDILGPPYSEEDGRDCTYYKDHPFSHLSGFPSLGAEESRQRLAWLEEIDIPKDLKMNAVEYLGPQVVEI